MTTREEIIALARECGIKNRVFPQSEVWGYERNIEAFYKAAQRQAYERAAEVCETECGEYFDGYEFQRPNNHDCAAAIRALIEGDEK